MKSKFDLKGFYVGMIFLFLMAGCSLPFPWPGDKDALKSNCYEGRSECQMSCREYDVCVTACESGVHACLSNIDEDAPMDWQPADAFYDGCSDSCSADVCSTACSRAQNVVAASSSQRLKKYGIITN